MNHITKQEAVELARGVPMNHWVGSEVHALCNAAIAHYIAQQAAPTVGLPFVPWSKESEMRESWAQAAPTKELTEEQLLWIARSHGINVPEGSLLGFYRDLMGTINIGNVDSVYTSQERVQKTAKSEQMPLTDDQCDKVLQRLDRWARDHDIHEYGLPLMLLPLRARDVLREALESVK